MKEISIVIGVPSGHLWEAQFATSLISLTSYCALKPIPGFGATTCRVVNIRSSVLPKNRLDLVHAARKVKADYLLFLDTDHTFPQNLLHKWIPHGKMCLAANCVIKKIPSLPTARAKDEGNPAGRMVFTDPESTGLEQVWRVGTGVMLLNMKVFDKVPDSAWAMPYRAEWGTYQGEDWTFAQALEDAGIPIWIDHELSKSIGHLGIYEYTHEVVGVVRNTDEV